MTTENVTQYSAHVKIIIERGSNIDTLGINAAVKVLSNILEVAVPSEEV